MGEENGVPGLFGTVEEEMHVSLHLSRARDIGRPDLRSAS